MRLRRMYLSHYIIKGYKKIQKPTKPTADNSFSFIGTSGISINLLKDNKLRATRRTETAGFVLIQTLTRSKILQKNPDYQGCLL
jgi:hypothetical protein